jgi:hypothetical protein
MADSSHSLTSHTLSSTRSAFPVLTPDLHSTLSQIIARVPPGSSSFSDLFRAYSEIVLHPQDDVEIYGAILKLGLEKGTDFRQKWASVLATQGISSGSLSQREEMEDVEDGDRLDILKARLDALDRAAGQGPETPRPFARRRSVTTERPEPSGRSRAGARSTPPSLEPRTRTVTDRSRSASAERYRTRTNSREGPLPRNPMYSNQSPIVDHHIRRHDRSRSQPMTSTPVKSRPHHAGLHPSPSTSSAAYTPMGSDSHLLPSHQTRKADRFRNVSLLGRALDVWRDRVAMIQVSKT